MAIKRYNSDESRFVDLIAKNFKLVRQSLGQTRDEVAGFFGVSAQQISKYEDGKDRISAAKLIMYANEYKVPIYKFFAVDDYTLVEKNLFLFGNEIESSLKRLNNSKYQTAVYQLIKNLDSIDTTQDS